MKKAGLFSVIVFSATLLFHSCEKSPGMDDLDGKSIVRTSYDKDADFRQQTNYFINDTVYALKWRGRRVIEKWDYENSKAARSMIDNVKSNLDARGYTQVGDTASCDLAVQVTFISNPTYFVSYPRYYWWDYWYYTGGPWYWGYYPYYPFPVIYAYSTGSTLIDMFDFNAPLKQDTGTGELKRPIVWNAFIEGPLTGSGMYNLGRILEGFDQAFEQSPYLKKE